jgi:hypothetical protein
VIAACGQGVTTQPTTGEPTPTEGESPTPTPGETPTPGPTPTPGGPTQRVNVTFTDVYVDNNSEPWITDPGECLFAVEANGNYFETPVFNCDDGSAYALSFPTIELDLAEDDLLLISSAGFEDDPTGYDALGSFDLQFGETANFGAGQHVQAGMFDPQTLGYFEVSFVVELE